MKRRYTPEKAVLKGNERMTLIRLSQRDKDKDKEREKEREREPQDKSGTNVAKKIDTVDLSPHTLQTTQR